MKLLAAFFLVFMLAQPALAASAKIVLCLDGAIVELEAAAAKGKVDIPLPRGVDPVTLRVKPLRGAVIASVEIMPAPPDRAKEKEAARLTARMEALADRLKALDAKEEIFRAAARSQSIKTPRPTKTNPDPMENVRKGTGFALAQLEEVFSARRKAESEFRSLESRLGVLKAPSNEGGRVARVRLEKEAGRVEVTYLNPGLKWVPAYDFRLDNSRDVDVTMRAVLPAIEKGTTVTLRNGLLAESSAGPPIPVSSEGPVAVENFRFPLEQEKYSPVPVSSLSFTFTNRSDRKMPAGDSTCYRQGEYIGKARFDGCLPGESKGLDVGRIAAGS